jgi:hypothetical protein
MIRPQAARSIHQRLAKIWVSTSFIWRKGDGIGGGVSEAVAPLRSRV